MIGVTLLTMLLTFQAPWAMWLVRKVWAPFVLFVLGVKVKVKGLEHINPRGNYIFISNHTSNLDIPILLATIPRTFYFIAKRELIRVPLFGQIMWLLGMIFIDRSNPRRSLRSMKLAAIKLKNGKNVLVFPEGTFDNDGHFLPFKKGTFHIAVKAKMPLLPLAISGASDIWPGGKMLSMKPGEVTINFGPAFEQEDSNDLNAITNLRDKGEAEVKRLLNELKKI